MCRWMFVCACSICACVRSGCCVCVWCSLADPLRVLLHTLRGRDTCCVGVTYKTGEVPTMMIDLTSKENKWNTDAVKKQQDDAAAVKATATKTAAPATEEASLVNEAPREQSAMDMVTALEEGSEQPKPTKTKAKTTAKPAVKKGFLNNAKTAGSIYPSGSNEGKRGVAPTAPLVQELPEGYVSKTPAFATSTANKTPSEAPLMTAREVTRKVKPPPSSSSSSSSVSGGKSNQLDEKVPKFTMIERGILGLGDFDGGNSSHKRKPLSNRPEELVYRIEIPLVNKTSKVELDVGEKELKMTYLDVYDMCIQLPYNVYEKKGGAKFDKVKKILTITLPVQPFQLDDDDEESVLVENEEVVDLVSEVSTANVTSSEEEESSKPKRVATSDHGRWLNTDSTAPSGGGGESQSDGITDEDTAEAPRVEEVMDDETETCGGGKKESLSEEIARKAKEALAEAKKMKKVEAIAAPKKKEKQVLVKGSDKAVGMGGTESTESEFIAAGSYIGSKKGYVFKTGDNGLGYYRDNGGKPMKKAPASVPKPVDSLDAIDINNSTISVDCSKNNSDKENRVENTATAIDWKTFEYQFRQTKEGIAMIIDVKNIIEESVSVNFQNQSFDVSFAAAAGDARVEVKTIDFGLSFDCMKELDTQACTFDVASDNMVIVLQKKVGGFWVSESNSAAIAKKEIIIAREYGGSVVNCSSSDGGGDDVETKSPVPESSLLANTMTSSGGDKDREDSGTGDVVDAMTLLKEMKFGSAAGLLELD
jgi:hypothetical protein